ncbi:hypothetical protein PR048_028888, partial [Dryococelus australis]
MEQRRNVSAEGTGDPREYPPTSGMVRHDFSNPPANGIVRHDSHLRKSDAPAGDWARVALVGDERAIRSASVTPSRGKDLANNIFVGICFAGVLGCAGAIAIRFVIPARAESTAPTVVQRCRPYRNDVLVDTLTARDHQRLLTLFLHVALTCMKLQFRSKAQDEVGGYAEIWRFKKLISVFKELGQTFRIDTDKIFILMETNAAFDLDLEYASVSSLTWKAAIGATVVSGNKKKHILSLAPGTVARRFLPAACVASRKWKPCQAPMPNRLFCEAIRQTHVCRHVPSLSVRSPTSANTKGVLTSKPVHVDFANTVAKKAVQNVRREEGGKFAFQDLDERYYDVIVFEEYSHVCHCDSFIKRLCDGMSVRLPVKGGLENVKAWGKNNIFGLFIMILLLIDWFLNGVTVVEANQPFSECEINRRCPSQTGHRSIVKQYSSSQPIASQRIAVCGTSDHCVPMRVIEVNMVKLRNERTGETGDSRENPPTNGIVQHDSHARKSGSDPAGDLARFALEEGEQVNRSAKAASLELVRATIFLRGRVKMRSFLLPVNPLVPVSDETAGDEPSSLDGRFPADITAQKGEMLRMFPGENLEKVYSVDLESGSESGLSVDSRCFLMTVALSLDLDLSFLLAMKEVSRAGTCP